MLELIDFMDFLSKKSELYINGRERLVSYTGRVLSIISGMCVLAITGYFLIEFANRTNFQIFENTIAVDLPILDYTNFPLAAYLSFANGKPVPLNTYKISTSKSDVSLDENQELITKISYADKSRICNEDDINTYFNYSKGMLCIPPGFNKTIYGRQGNINSGFSYLIFNIFKCRNGTFYDEYGKFHNNTDCADEATIEAALNMAHLAIEFLDNKINHLNFQPFENRKNSVVFPLSWSLYRDIYFRFQLVDYESDIGYLFNEITTNSTFRFLETETIINTRSFQSGLFASIRFTLSGEKILYSRKYMKLQVTLANIGGFTKFVLFIAQFIVQYLTERFYYLYLIDKFFAEERITSISEKAISRNLDFELKINNNENDNIIVIDKEKSIDQNIIIANHSLINTTQINNYIPSNFSKLKQDTTQNNINNDKNNTEETNLLYLIKIKDKVNKNKNLTRMKKLYTIWDLILVIFKRKNKNVKSLQFAKKQLKIILSLNNILKMNLKLDNLIDIIFSTDEKDEFEKIKMRRIYYKL